VAHAAYLAELVRAASPELELLAPVPLNVVCFRYARGAGDLNALNKEILGRLQESGVAAPSHTISAAASPSAPP